jgi:hypothetical protein
MAVCELRIADQVLSRALDGRMFYFISAVAIRYLSEILLVWVTTLF